METGKESLIMMATRHIKIFFTALIIVAIVFVMMLIFPIGIGMHIDSTTTFHVHGTILNSNSNAISGVEVFFVDRGFDYVRSKNTAAGTTKLGVSGNNGMLDFTYPYFWGRNEPFLLYFFDYHLNLSPRKPCKTFDLIFKKDGYIEKTMRYDAKTLTERNNVVEVDIGQVKMDR
jgi:hypothetical protein